MVLGTESNVVIILMIAIILFFVYYKSFVQSKVLPEQEQKDKKSNNKKHQSDEDISNEQFSMKKKSRSNDDGDDDDRDSDNNDYYRDQDQKKSSKKRLGNILRALNNNDNDNNPDSDSEIDLESLHNDNIPVNTEFVEMQYHNDYNDTITAINNLTPQKELFNLGYLPVRQIIPDPRNINSLVGLFMDKLNFEIKNNVQEYLNVNSAWTDMGKRRREKSGFETQMEELGLPGCLYNEPAVKAPLILVKVDKVEQSNTNDQIRFTAYIIVQKVNVRDQMVLQVNFFMEREDLGVNRDDRDNFFSKGLENQTNKVDPNQAVIIEQVFTLGYLTNETKHKTKMDKFHDYKKIHRTDGTINQEEVIKTMLIKHKERQNELDSFMCTLDNDTKEIHGVPDIDNYSQYKNTRTIMDDLAEFPQKSFGAIQI